MSAMVQIPEVSNIIENGRLKGKTSEKIQHAWYSNGVHVE